MPFEADPCPDPSRRTETMLAPNPTPILEPPVVLIAGAGVGGLTAALICERANINYKVFERAAKVKPLGSSLCLSPNITPALAQLGLLEDIKRISLTANTLDMFKENMKHIGAIDGTAYRDVTGYDGLFMARSDLYALLLSKIPSEKIHMGKKIMSIQQNVEGVMIRCADNTHYHGDILIGADGAYSGVRQSLYKQLHLQGLLPAEDKEDMPLAYLCMVGTTRPLDPEKYMALKEKHCDFVTVLGKGKPHSWTTVTVPGNRISWMVWIQVEAGDIKDTRFNNSEWGPEANKSMINEIRQFPITHGGVLGDLIDATDSDLISRVYIEEKLYQTWNHGRTALIGDGAVGAMQDAVILMNCIYDIEDVTHENIKAALADYKAQRFEHALEQINLGKTFAKIMFGQTWRERVMRTIVYNLPKWAQTKNHMKMAAYRPLITFLPPVPNTTHLKLVPQKPSKRYAKEQAATASNGGAV
ncbi:hypothetical protein CPC16_000102 [Podila verticillata]|nr:hypothetical protein BGZ59_011307 [Podila verticillata]KAF9376619.1 hypothetical protein CPC16_000102 [Podila verticillata]